MELVEQQGVNVTTACRLFGHCRQAFYQSKADIEQEVKRDRLIIDNVREIREEDPGIGGYKPGLCSQNFTERNRYQDATAFSHCFVVIS